jgi:ubiquinone biosynthesis protein
MMRRLRLALRLAHIQRVLMRHGLDEFVRATHLYRPLRLLARLPTFSPDAANRGLPRGVRVREALQELGPIFVKFGQSLSTRPDLLPDDIAGELAKLQDAVPPFPGAEARRLAEAAYRRPLADVFRSFEDRPIAAASIAQVHAARLTDGREVAVKILRPGVEAQIRRDLEVMYAVAGLARRYWTAARPLRPLEVVREYERIVTDELDLMREAANAAQLRRNFEDSPQLYIPEVHWDYCRPTVLVTERIHGIPVGDVETLKSRDVDLAALSATGVEIFFTQVFRHNFFHADMHPGNIFVDPTDPAAPRYLAVDFGIVGSLDPRDQQYLAENFLAFFNRDYRRVAMLHINSGWVPEGTRLDELEAAFRTVCEPIFNRPLAEISFGQFLVRLFTTARRFGMEVQPQLILLQKTLLNIEGLGRQLYPGLDLWATAKPILEEWMAERVSGRAVINRLREQLPEVGETLQEFPQVVHNLLQRAADGRLELKVSVPALEQLERRLEERDRNRYLAVAGGAVLISGILWIGFAMPPSWAGTLIAATGATLMLLGRPGRD